MYLSHKYVHTTFFLNSFGSSSHARQRYQFTRRMFTRSVRKTLVFNTIFTVCITQTVYYISLLRVKYGMHAYAGPACICRMHAPSMLFPPTQFHTNVGKSYEFPKKSS